MSGNMSFYNKCDIALAPSSYAASEQTSSYFDLEKYERVIFICSAGTITSSGNIALRMLQAKTSTGSGVAAVTGIASTMNGTPTAATVITRAAAGIIENGWTNSSEASTGLVIPSSATLAVNGVTFTFLSSSAGTAAPTTSDFATARLICTSSNQLTPWDTNNHLVAYINNGTYGCTGLLASVAGAASSYVQIIVNPSGEKVITITQSTSGFVMYPSQMVGIMECHGAELATSSDYKYVALGVTPSAIMHLGVVAVRGGVRFTPDTTSQVSAYDFGV